MRHLVKRAGVLLFVEGRKTERNANPELPYLRAGFLDAVRPWPTTPVLLRDAVAAT